MFTDYTFTHTVDVLTQIQFSQIYPAALPSPVDVSIELLHLGQQLGLGRVVALLFARPLAAQYQPGLSQTQDVLAV